MARAVTRPPTRVRCPCGAWATVTRGRTRWELEWRCACGRSGVVSWAHAHPPPAWHDPDPDPAADAAAEALHRELVDQLHREKNARAWLTATNWRTDLTLADGAHLIVWLRCDV
jgi:hypothetical protein